MCGYSVELESKPKQFVLPNQFKFSDIETQKLREEITRFEQNKIIEQIPDSQEPGEFISNIFSRPKKDGKIRIILNLKSFNENMQNIHFKMETLDHAIKLVTKNCYFASVDLSDAYYSIPLDETDKKFFRFYFDGKKYQFTVLIMGLATAPRVFTKILKPVFATLRKQGFLSTIYIDDSCLLGTSFDQCTENVWSTVKLLDSLGLTVNPKKSVLIPTQQITFVGFVLCSRTMTIKLTTERIINIKNLCAEIKIKKFITIRKFSRLVGMLVASEPGVLYAPLYYKPLEKIKLANLNAKKGNFDAYMRVTSNIRFHVQWWIDNLDNSLKPIHMPEIDIILTTDSSLTGWGAKTNLGQFAQGVWSVDEQKQHINVLELKACQHGLLSLGKEWFNKHVQILTDNTTACAYLSKFGGRKLELDGLARNIWSWCINRHIHLSVAHIPGSSNDEADELSRIYNDDTEWSLHAETFQHLEVVFGKFDIDLFASRLNAKTLKYVSRFPEAAAVAIDAFSISWKGMFIYVFPPFSLISRVLQKVVRDQAEGVIVVPLWCTQTWWPCLNHMTVGTCLELPSTQKILRLEHKPDQRHPLKRLKLAAFRISGSLYTNRA